MRGHFILVRAVTASFALPGPFSPIVLKNYAGQCDYKAPEWVKEAVSKRDILSGAYWMASAINGFTDAQKKPCIYLVDGGVSDNLGIIAVFDPGPSLAAEPVFLALVLAGTVISYI